MRAKRMQPRPACSVDINRASGANAVLLAGGPDHPHFIKRRSTRFVAARFIAPYSLLASAPVTRRRSSIGLAKQITRGIHQQILGRAVRRLIRIPPDDG